MPQFLYTFRRSFHCTVGAITLQVKAKMRWELQDFPLPAPNPFSESFAPLGAVDRDLAVMTLTRHTL